ncbi:16314_t:CDS:2, partial [Funneliformis mosseae]
QLQKIVDEKEEKVSEELGQIAQKVANEITENKIDISPLNPIFQELIRIQTNLECISIHTCESICDEARENRNHIESFDWWASIWSIDDIIEVNIGKNNYKKVNREALKPVRLN